MLAAKAGEAAGNASRDSIHGKICGDGRKNSVCRGGDDCLQFIDSTNNVRSVCSHGICGDGTRDSVCRGGADCNAFINSNQKKGNKREVCFRNICGDGRSGSVCRGDDDCKMSLDNKRPLKCHYNRCR